MKLWRYATDGLILLGAALAVTGVWLIHPPTALIVGGACLVFLAVIGGKHG